MIHSLYLQAMLTTEHLVYGRRVRRAQLAMRVDWWLRPQPQRTDPFRSHMIGEAGTLEIARLSGATDRAIRHRTTHRS